MDVNTSFNKKTIGSKLEYTLDKMVEKISSKTKISPFLIRQYGERAFYEWEKKSGRSLNTLFKMKSEDRSANIYSILKNFRNSLEPIILSVKKMDKTMCIASVSMEILFCDEL